MKRFDQFYSWTVSGDLHPESWLTIFIHYLSVKICKKSDNSWCVRIEWSSVNTRTLWLCIMYKYHYYQLKQVIKLKARCSPRCRSRVWCWTWSPWRACCSHSGWLGRCLLLYHWADWCKLPPPGRSQHWTAGVAAGPGGPGPSGQ